MKVKVLSLFILVFLNSRVGNSHVVIINSENTEASIDRLAVKDIFIGQTLFWDDGSNILVADYNAVSEVRKEFSRVVLGMPPNKVYLNWIRISLSGKGAPPKIFRSEDEVVKFVEENPNAIGYIDKFSPNDHKALKVVTLENVSTN